MIEITYFTPQEVWMKRATSPAKFFFSLFVFLWIAALAYAQTSPETFLGFKAGADKKLADYNQIKA